MAQFLNGLTLTAPSGNISINVSNTFNMTLTPSFRGSGSVTNYSLTWEWDQGTGSWTAIGTSTSAGLYRSGTNPLTTNTTSASTLVITGGAPGVFNIRGNGDNIYYTGTVQVTVNATVSASVSESISASVSESSSPSPSVSESTSPSPSVSESVSPSPSLSESTSPSPSVSESSSPSPSVSESISSSISESTSPSPSVSESLSPSPSVSASISESISESSSPSPSLSESISESFSESSSPSPSVSESVSSSISESTSPSPSVSPSTSESISESTSPSPSVSASISASISASTSESTSPSPSVSESSSPSPSTSESTSPSTSESSSASLSESVSPSTSPSPSAGDTLWYTREALASIPTGIDYLDTEFTSQDYTDVSADNSTRVSITGNEYPMFQFMSKNTNNTNAINITWNGQSSVACSDATVYLQIYNRTSQEWETLDSDSTTVADTDFNLTGSKTTSLTDYYDGNYWIVCRVYQ